MSTDAALHRDVIHIAQEMDRLGFAPSKSGNVSARAPHGLLITPSALPYAQTKPADLVLLDLDGKVLAGKRPPSSEWRFHGAVCRPFTI